MDQGDRYFSDAYREESLRLNRPYLVSAYTLNLVQQQQQWDLQYVQTLANSAATYYNLADKLYFERTGSHAVLDYAREKFNSFRYIPRTTWILLPGVGSSSSSYSSSSSSTSPSRSTSGGTSAPRTPVKTFQYCTYDGWACRVIFRNNHYCTDEYLGSNWECLAQEKTRPRACYCWD